MSDEASGSKQRPDGRAVDQLRTVTFKNNIYDTTCPGKLIQYPDSDYSIYFDPRHFIEIALKQEEDVLSFIERQPREYWREDFSQFYPHIGRANSLYALKEILRT